MTAVDPGTEERGRRGGLELEDVTRQAEVLRKAAAASPIRQVTHLLSNLAVAFDDANQAALWAAENDVSCAVELAGVVVAGMTVISDKGPLRLSRVVRRDGDWALHLVFDDFEQQMELNAGKRDYYVPLAADAASPVAVVA